MKLPLLEHSAAYVDEGFLRMNPPAKPVPDRLIYAGEGAEPSYEKIAAALAEAMKNPVRTAGEGQLAVSLHQLLAISRRAASDMKFWHYLSIVGYPEYVSWRYFDEKTATTNKARYLGSMPENAFSRLWWWAELTANRFTNEPYEITLKASESLEFVRGVLENLCGGTLLLVKALYTHLFKQGRPQDQLVKEVFLKINALLVTVSVDSLSEPDVEDLTGSVLQSVR